MFNRQEFGRILVPMVTPFCEDYTVDYEAAIDVAKKLIAENKADSLILSGTTGEFHAMTFDERVRLFEVIKSSVGDSIPLIAGVGAASTTETVALAQKAEEFGFDLLMVVAPYYTKPNQTELYSHFKRVAESVSVNILLYNIPIFTGVNLNADTVAQLANLPNVVGIKEEAELNPKQMTQFINCTPEDFIIYCGDDTMILEAYAQGGAKRIGGIVSGGSHLIGDQIRTMIDTFLAGNVEEAAQMQQRFFRLFRIMGQNGRTNPVSLLKEAMKMMGYNAGLPRPPLSPGTEEEKANVRKVMQELGLL